MILSVLTQRGTALNLRFCKSEPSPIQEIQVFQVRTVPKLLDEGKDQNTHNKPDGGYGQAITVKLAEIDPGNAGNYHKPKGRYQVAQLVTNA